MQIPSDLAVVKALLSQEKKERLSVDVPPSTFAQDVVAIHGEHKPACCHPMIGLWVLDCSLVMWLECFWCRLATPATSISRFVGALARAAFQSLLVHVCARMREVGAHGNWPALSNQCEVEPDQPAAWFAASEMTSAIPACTSGSLGAWWLQGRSAAAAAVIRVTST